MLDCLKAITGRKQVFLQQEYYLEPQVSKFSQARMQRKFTQTVQQQFSAQKSA